MKVYRVNFLKIPADKLVGFIWDNCDTKTLPMEFKKFSNLGFVEINYFVHDSKAPMKEFPLVLYELQPQRIKA